MAEPTTDNTNIELEAEKKEAFLKEYRDLALKYGYDWYQPPLQLTKIRNDSN